MPTRTGSTRCHTGGSVGRRCKVIVFLNAYFLLYILLSGVILYFMVGVPALGRGQLCIRGACSMLGSIADTVAASVLGSLAAFALVVVGRVLVSRWQRRGRILRVLCNGVPAAGCRLCNVRRGTWTDPSDVGGEILIPSCWPNKLYGRLVQGPRRLLNSLVLDYTRRKELVVDIGKRVGEEGRSGLSKARRFSSSHIGEGFVDSKR